MSRSERLLDLIQLLRRHRTSVSGAVIARELGISLRTLYRDVATLQAQGAEIDGAPGLGYLLRPGFVLPPLMFGADEIEALALGMRWVSDRGDSRLAAAARNALAKISAVLPEPLGREMATSGLLVGPGEPIAAGDAELATIRQAVRLEHRLRIAYRDKSDAESTRVVWPFAIGFFDRARVVVAWCELRQAIRHFRTDRIVSVEPIDERYPLRRTQLIAQWRAQEGIAERL